MTENTARDLWDARAASRLQFMQTKKMARFNALYEDACWQFIEPFLPAGDGRIREAGCGTGRWVYRLVPLGHQVMLSDFPPEKLRDLFSACNLQVLHEAAVCPFFVFSPETGSSSGFRR